MLLCKANRMIVITSRCEVESKLNFKETSSAPCSVFELQLSYFGIPDNNNLPLRTALEIPKLSIHHEGESPVLKVDKNSECESLLIVTTSIMPTYNV